MTESVAAAPAPKLDDLMLAMDVVDTLRHQEKVVETELSEDERDAALKAKLRALYESQGLDVTDRILDAGIKALKESRFTYERRGSPFARWMAGLWIHRGRAGLAVLVLVLGGLAYVGTGLWQQSARNREAEQARIELTQNLPKSLADAAAGTLAQAKVTDARKAVEQVRANGEASLAAGDVAGARDAIAELGKLKEKLTKSYSLRISPKQSGVYRIPDVNNGARNYYIIVEAVNEIGQLIPVPVLNEETNQVETVSSFGVRVPQAVYEAVRADKLDDGIIQNNILGEKPRGSLDVVFAQSVLPGRITKW